MTFPSAGCQTCKLRRVKCDETQPVCQRCIKAKRTCVGMRAAEDSSVIHIENSYASGKMKRPRGPRSRPPVEKQVLNLAEPSSKLLKVVPDPPIAPSLPAQDLKTQAVVYYLHYHSQSAFDAPEISKSCLDHLVPLWKSHTDNPILDLAVSSMALAVFSKTHMHPPAAVQASMKYQQLLQITQMTILSLDHGNVDLCLFAIFFMSRYEDAVHQPSSSCVRRKRDIPLRSFSHHDGALAILKVWKERLSESHGLSDVVKHTRRGIIRSAILRNLALPEWMWDGASFGEVGLELQYDSLVLRIANIRHELAALLKEENGIGFRDSYELGISAAKLREQAREIDKDLQQWKTAFPQSWRYHKHMLPDPHPWPMRDFYSPTVYSYSCPAYAMVLNQYFAMRMLVNNTRLRILKLLKHHHDELHSASDFDVEFAECLADIKKMGNDLACSVPYCLQRFKVTKAKAFSAGGEEKVVVLTLDEDIKPYVASMVIWPLGIASSVGFLDEGMKVWLRSELARLGRMVGAGVLEGAEKEWMDL
ncbi:hypothetical protein G7Y89_g3903 [Cudoniella acicularis]|uniref:Zn(2)-C6 fungal-type domain-containing protein n=1 Tax=Cudoniella acicularis TaxID=354080 RepID=A0A8H4W4R9_9HELO|nr:hypothetical protein G7Y89_g3903 [Cudoniella acicularis]